MPAQKLSGLQRDVLSLYRQCLRTVSKKPAAAQPRFRAFVRDQFEKGRDVDRKDFATVDHLLRKGNRMLENFATKDVKDIAPGG